MEDKFNPDEVIQIKCFHITEHGDESVGIPSQHWTLEGKNGFTFDKSEYLEQFRIYLGDLMELVCADRPTIQTDIELRQEAEAEAAMESEMPDYPIFGEPDFEIAQEIAAEHAFLKSQNQEIPA